MYKQYLKDLELKRDKNGYFLSAVYIEENNSGIYEHIIPHMILPINESAIISEPCISREVRPDLYADIGFGDLLLSPDKNGNYYYTKTIREKIHDLTLSDIEKKLGYKVRIVNE